ncbi:hypothetical protein [Nonomuraea sp. SYSU D8015]|uniref:hypothetical protein n=1 Tax=Nonomuraea sp. SYSU D8015 TaxID=2593644 RepID=UPI00166103C4|nr:hypothetical protein [Nonomuraea sp. SYSU D8015]
MGDQDILDQIDDVIHWDGHSEDAMEWTSEPPNALQLPAPPRIDSEATQQALEQFGRQMQAIVDVFRPVAEQMARNFVEIGRVFAVIGNALEMSEPSEEERLRRRAMKSEYARRRRGRRG